MLMNGSDEERYRSGRALRNWCAVLASFLLTGSVAGCNAAHRTGEADVQTPLVTAMREVVQDISTPEQADLELHAALLRTAAALARGGAQAEAKAIGELVNEMSLEAGVPTPVAHTRRFRYQDPASWRYARDEKWPVFTAGSQRLRLYRQAELAAAATALMLATGDQHAFDLAHDLQSAHPVLIRYVVREQVLQGYPEHASLWADQLPTDEQRQAAKQGFSDARSAIVVNGDQQ